MTSSQLQAFAELVPLSASSHSTTLLRPNLRHIICEPRSSTSAPALIERRIVVLSFDALLGHSCFSFGSARSNDYQLPFPGEVAPHHFIMFFHQQKRILYLRNTSPQGLYITLLGQRSRCIQSCCEPVEVAPNMLISVGGPSGVKFEVVTPTSFDSRLRERNLTLHFDLMHYQSGPPYCDASLTRKVKRRRSTTEELGTMKRQRVRELNDCSSRLLTDSSNVEIKRNWGVRLSHLLSGFFRAKAN